MVTSTVSGRLGAPPLGVVMPVGVVTPTMVEAVTSIVQLAVRPVAPTSPSTVKLPALA